MHVGFASTWRLLFVFQWNSADKEGNGEHTKELC